jgi:uncharacterized protein (UPF0332 family)
MTGHRSRELDRADQELKAACVLADGGFMAQAVSRAYYATRYAAEAALHAIGESPSDHDAVISAFRRDVVEARELAAVHGLALASLFDMRIAADYGLEQPDANETWMAIESAEHFVEAVKTWLAAQPPR